MSYSDPDRLAQQLASLGNWARRLPRSFAALGDNYPVTDIDGHSLGTLLPGRGLLLRGGAKDCGLKRLPRNVIDPDPVRRIADRLSFFFDENRAVIAAVGLAALASRLGTTVEVLWPFALGAVTSYNDIISARANGKAEDVFFAKTSFTTVAAQWFNTFLAAGLPGAGSYTNIPTGAALDRTTTGALSSILTSPSNPDLKYLLTFGYGSTQAINWGLVVDMLVAAGNIGTNSVATSTISTTALTRYTDGAGVFPTFDITTALGSTASNLQFIYTNSAGTATRTASSVALIASGIAKRVAMSAGPLPFCELQAGDVGVRSIQTLTCSATMGAGVMAVSLCKPLHALAPMASNIFVERDSNTQIDGLTELVQASGVIGCLNLLLNTNTTTSGQISGFMRTCAG